MNFYSKKKLRDKKLERKTGWNFKWTEKSIDKFGKYFNKADSYFNQVKNPTTKKQTKYESHKVIVLDDVTASQCKKCKWKKPSGQSIKIQPNKVLHKQCQTTLWGKTLHHTTSCLKKK